MTVLLRLTDEDAEVVYGLTMAAGHRELSNLIRGALDRDRPSHVEITRVNMDRRISAIRALRTVVPGLNLRDAKFKIEAPGVIPDEICQEDAKWLAGQLVEIGYEAGVVRVAG